MADFKLTAESLTPEFLQVMRQLMHAEMHDELYDVREDLRTIKHVQGVQSLQLRELQATMGSLKNTVREHASELHRLNVLFEDFYDRLSTVRELRWD